VQSNKRLFLFNSNFLRMKEPARLSRFNCLRRKIMHDVVIQRKARYSNLGPSSRASKTPFLYLVWSEIS